MRWLKKALGLAGRARAEELVTRGYVAAREGRLDDAQRAYVDATEAEPELAVAWLDAGLCAVERYNRDAPGLDDDARRARLDEAAAFLEQAVALDDASLSSWRALGRVAQRQGRFARADEAWARAEALIVDDAERVEARRARASLQVRARLERALASAQQALVDDDADRGAALVELLAAVDASSGDDEESALPTRIWGLAGALARKAHDPQARALLERAVDVDPTDLLAWRELATVCMGSGDAKAALRASMHAYRLEPTDAGLVCNVGVCHLALGDLAQAHEFIELAQQLDPKGPIIVRAVAGLAAARATPSS